MAYRGCGMRFASFFLLAVLITAPLSAHAGGVAAMLAKHETLVGWSSSDATMASWKASGMRRSAGAIDDFTETRRGLLFHDTVTNGGAVSDEIGFSGRYVWHADENHFWSMQLGRRAQSAIAFDIVRDEALAQFHPMLAGQSRVNGLTCDILRVQPAGLVPIDVYEDHASGAFVRVVVAPGAPDTRIFNNLTYKKLANGRSALAAWSEGDVRYELHNVDVTAVSDSDLQPTGSQASWTYSMQPLSFALATANDNSHLIRVGASVNGHSGVFLLSTNTPSIVLYDDFARQAGLQPMGTSDFSPYIGNLQFLGYARASTIQIGAATLHNAVVQRISSPGNRLAGVFGYDFFADAIVNVEIDKQQMTILDPHAYEPQTATGGYAFPIDLTDRVPVITLALEHGVAHPVFDTGLGGFVILAQALRDNGGIGGHDITSQTTVGFGGMGATGDPIATKGLNVTYTSWNGASTSGTCINAAQILVGPYKYENPPVCFGGYNVFGSDGGAVGLDFLRHFNWTIDYPHSRFIVTPNNQ